MKMSNITYSLGLDNIDIVSVKIIEFMDINCFSLWLKGQMGVGKTALAGSILYNLGLDRSIAVTSPSYTYLNDYSIGDINIAHIDRYKSDINLNDLEEMCSYKDFNGFIIEWPELGDDIKNSLFKPTHTVNISLLKETNMRNYDINFEV